MSLCYHCAVHQHLYLKAHRCYIVLFPWKQYSHTLQSCICYQEISDAVIHGNDDQLHRGGTVMETITSATKESGAGTRWWKRGSKCPLHICCSSLFAAQLSVRRSVVPQFGGWAGTHTTTVTSSNYHFSISRKQNRYLQRVKPTENSFISS